MVGRELSILHRPLIEGVRLALALAVLTAAFTSIGCGAQSSNETASPGSAASGADDVTPSPIPRATTSLDLPARIAVTLPVFEDFVRQAGGDHAEVFSLVPVGVDPGTHQLGGEDIERLKGVKFFYANGLGLDDHILRSIEENRDERAYVIQFGPNVRSPTLRDVYADEAGDEPHLWLDPDLAAVYVAIVADEFVIYDEANRSFYEDRFRASRERLTSFADELSSQLSAIPEERRMLVAGSEALTHFARRFSFDLFGLPAVDGAANGVAEAVQRLTRVVQENDVPAVFAEHGHDNSTIQAVAEQTGAEICTLHTDIAADDMPDYESIMRANVAEVIRCLGR